MSTKTTFKRVALVAVASLGFGVLSSVAPASAATATTDVPYSLVATLNSPVTSYTYRVGQTVSVPVAGSIAAGTALTNGLAYLSVAAAVTSQPATSLIYPTLTSATAPTGTANIGEGLNTAAVGAATTVATAAVSDTGTSTTTATINYSQATKVDTAFAAVASGTLATLSFVPTVAGAYTVVVWNETSRAVAAPGTTGHPAFASAEAALSGAESFQTFTINVTGAPTAIAVSAVNSTAAASASAAPETGKGSLVKVSLKDAAGNTAVLASGEFVTVTPTLSGDIRFVNDVAVTSTAGAAYNLSSADFLSDCGCAWINIGDATAETVSITAAFGAVAATTSLTFRTIADIGDGDPTPYGTSGFISVAGTSVTVPIGATTVTYSKAGTYVAATPSYAGVLVTDTNKKISGSATLTLDYAAAATVDSDGLAWFSVSSSSVATGESIYSITGLDADGVGGNGAVAVASLTSSAGNGTATPSVVNTAPGSSVSISVNVKNNFLQSMANVVVTATVTGRNPSVVAQSAVTDSKGNATFTFADTNSTSLITSSTVTFGGATISAATINYAATNVASTITLTSTGDTDLIPGTTKTDISAAAAGATGTSATASAVVKNAAGTLLAGVPVTFTVTGLVGAEVHTSKAVVYTNSIGVAASNVSSYAAGKATVTATAGTVSASDDIYFEQATATEARTIAISAEAGVVKATVKDRYGNPIKGVTVDASRTGTGYFGTGASTAQGLTDANGVVEFIFVGSGTVKVAFTSATYGQSYAAAGYDFDAVNGTAITASVAGTSVTNQTGLGAALAPAGINSASLAVDSGVTAAEVAADAAAEATDAANAATDAANAAAEAADAATAAAQDAADAVAALSTQVSEMVNALKKQITALTNLVIKIQKKVRA